MKKFVKILGVGLTIAILASLLIAVTPASAGNQTFSKDSKLGDIIGKIATGTDVVDIAVAANGSTAYAALSNSTVWKTTDGGSNWVQLTKYTGGVPSSIAVAPDSADYIAVTSGTTLYISLNGGVTFGTSAPATSFGTINDVAVGPTMGAGRSLAVADATNGLWVFAPIPNDVFGSYQWSDVTTGTSNVTGTALAVEFSSSFATGDYTVVVVTTENTTQSRFNVYNTYFGVWNADYALYGAPNLGVTLATTAAPTKADIALPAAFYGFDSARIAYVALNNGGLFRVKQTSSTAISTAAMFSVDYNSSADKLVAGAVTGAIVYTVATPSASTAATVASSTLKAPGGTGMVVARFFGTNIGAGTSGDESAFALSATGSTFNDVAFVDTTPNVVDLAVASDASMTYLVTSNGVTTSLWVKATDWQRVFKVAGSGWFVHYSLDNVNVVFLAQAGTSNIYYSNDAGKTTWQIRVGPAGLIDLAVQTPSIIYAIATGGVLKATDSGIIWNALLVDVGTETFINLIAADNLLVTGSNGVAFSIDAGATWTTTGLSLTGALAATADKLTSGGVINAITAGAVKKFTIGTSTAFADAVATTAYAANSISRLGTLAYAMTSNGTAFTMYRGPITSTTWTTISSTTVGLFKLQTAGGKLWALASDNGIYVFSEVLAAAGPAQVSPVDGFKNQINIETGKADAVVFQWTAVANTGALTGVTYELGIYLDTAATQMVYDITGLTSVLNVIGPNTPIAPYTGFDFQANTNYYWRVRVMAPNDSPWSSIRNFRIEALSPIRITSPASGAMDVSITPTLVWTAVRNATQYQISVATDAAFQNILFSRNAITPEFAITEDLALDYNTVYYWRVRASAPPEVGSDYVFGIFTTEQAPTTTQPPFTITQPAPTTITITTLPQQELIPAYLLWIIIGIGAILVIALIVLIVRTRRVS